MDVEKIKIGEKKVMPFTIPSGIVTTSTASLAKLAREVEVLGILTTKSIGPVPRAGNREPIFAQYAPGCFVNAVGLTNSGCEAFAEELSRISFPGDKFLLASIFGANADEFVRVAKTLESRVDGFELNLSCPHVVGHGMQLGQDPDVVFEIVYRLKQNIDKPVFAKLTPNVSDVGEIAKAAVSAGVNGIVAINTVGPGCHMVNGYEVLTNKVGGLSGAGILPVGIKCVRDIRTAVGKGVFILGMGGIRTADDIRAFASAGANAFGIGSALVGMDDRDISDYFAALGYDLWEGTNLAESRLKAVDMSYRKVRVEEVVNENCDFRVYKTNHGMECLPGQFAFAWIPGVGEKPFSVMDDYPLTLGVLTRGYFTERFNSLKSGDEFYVRGPYGQGVEVPEDSSVVLVGGGCGIAGLYLLAKRLSEKNQVISLLGAKDKEHLPYLERFSRFGDVRVITEDGSLGRRGTVSDLLRVSKLINRSYFFNCGPRAMVEAVLPLELEISSPDKVYSSVDYMTRCGVGICGSCADAKGRRTCAEGPFMKS